MPCLVPERTRQLQSLPTWLSHSCNPLLLFINKLTSSCWFSFKWEAIIHFYLSSSISLQRKMELHPFIQQGFIGFLPTKLQVWDLEGNMSNYRQLQQSEINTWQEDTEFSEAHRRDSLSDLKGSAKIPRSAVSWEFKGLCTFGQQHHFPQRTVPGTANPVGSATETQHFSPDGTSDNLTTALT